MELLKILEKYNTSDLYVGEIYDPQAFFLDENGKPTGETKAITTNRFDVAIRNENGDYVSIVDGTVYSDGAYEKFADANNLPTWLFFHVKTFAEETGCKKKRISKKAAIKVAKELRVEKTDGVEV